MSLILPKLIVQHDNTDQAAAMYGKTCGQKLSDVGNYLELDK